MTLKLLKTYEKCRCAPHDAVTVMIFWRSLCFGYGCFSDTSGVLKDIVGSPCDSDDLEDCKLSGLWLTRRYRGVIVIAGRVLVVDDDEAIQDFICASLSDDGYEVMVASNGNAALEAVKTFQPSVILLDMRMPGMSGEGFLLRYEEIADYRVPVIALSASNQCREEILKLGASDYLAKPFNLTDLMSCIEYWIQARQV